MADRAIKEAIQRARQLAAKISQNAPVKRTASEMEHDHSIDKVKVTLAYEKPSNSDQTNPGSGGGGAAGVGGPGGGGFGASGNNGGGAGGGIGGYGSMLSGGSMLGGSAGAGGGGGGGGCGGGYGSMLGSGSGGGGSHNSNSNSNSNYMNCLSTDEKIEIIIPHAVIGLVIGKGGENIKKIQSDTGATVRVDPSTVDEKGNKVCTITGTKQAVELAHSRVSEVIENAATNKRPRTHVDGADQYKMKIPASRTGAIIGKGGDTIKSIKQQSGCDIELDKNSKECGPDESMFIIRGTQDKIQKAKSLIEARLASRGNRDGDHHHNLGRTNHSAPKGLATGANAAPVAQYTDLPTSYPAAGQQTSADMSAAWAAYFAQYSTLMNQAGTQPGATAAAAAGIPYAGQNLLGPTGAQQVPQTADQSSLQQQQQPTQQQPQQQSQQHQQLPGTQQQDAQPQQDYTDQWIEFYLRAGRPDYAEQIIQMKQQKQMLEPK